MWIELPWPENLPNTYAWYTGTLDSCFDLIRSHQQCIPVISTTGDWTSDHRLQCQNSTTEPPVHIAHKWCQINLKNKNMYKEILVGLKILKSVEMIDSNLMAAKWKGCVWGRGSYFITYDLQWLYTDFESMFLRVFFV